MAEIILDLMDEVVVRAVPVQYIEPILQGLDPRHAHSNPELVLEVGDGGLVLVDFPLEVLQVSVYFRVGLGYCDKSRVIICKPVDKWKRGEYQRGQEADRDPGAFDFVPGYLVCHYDSPMCCETDEKRPRSCAR